MGSFSPLGKPADRAIYFVCVNFFFFRYFFNTSKAISVSTGLIFTIDMATNFVSDHTCSLGAEVSQDLLDRFSQSLHHTFGIELLMIITFYFSRYLKGCCHGNPFCGKNWAKLPTLCTYRSVIPIRNGLSLSQ